MSFCAYVNVGLSHTDGRVCAYIYMYTSVYAYINVYNHTVYKHADTREYMQAASTTAERNSRAARIQLHQHRKPRGSCYRGRGLICVCMHVCIYKYMYAY